MHISILLLLSSLLYLILITVLFAFKKKIKTLENKIYSWLIFVCFIGVFLDIAGIYSHLHLSDTSMIRWLIVKFYLLYLLTFTFLLTTYILMVGFDLKRSFNELLDKQKIYFYIVLVLYLICLVLNFILPFEYFKEGNIVYVFGANATFLFGVTGLNMLFWIYYFFYKLKTIRKKKIVPMIAFIVIAIPVAYLQMLKPELLLVTSLATFIVIFMYHTIENPDMKLISELNIAKDIADAANLAKSDFLSSMSHEIRTPLNAIVGFSQTLKEKNLPSDLATDVDDILVASESLIDIVNGILDISKIEANKLEIINIEYDPHKIFNELIALSKSRIGDKNIEFKFQIDPTIPTVLYGDYVRLKQIVLNLLTNAIKYTKEGYVEFKVNSLIKDDVCRLIISIEDTGIGIKKIDIDKLFQKFERIDTEKNISIEGTGLGLAITKSLVELMGGEVIVHSVYGKGSQFTVTINQRVIEKPVNESIGFETVTKTKTTYQDKRILIVDDNLLNLKVASRLLATYEVLIDQSESGFDCLNKIKNGEKYDLILMDDMMPNMSGVETLQKLKEDPNFKTPVIALTANAIAGMREKYLSDGFDEYLPKPVNRDELTQIINKFLK